MRIELSVQIKQACGKLLLPTEATLTTLEMYKIWYRIAFCRQRVLKLAVWASTCNHLPIVLIAQHFDPFILH